LSQDCSPANFFGQEINSVQKNATNFLKASEGSPGSFPYLLVYSFLLYVMALKVIS